MASTIPLRTPLDESELPHPAPAAAVKPGVGATARGQSTGTLIHDQGEGMALGSTVTITPDEHRQIFERLAPHLPPYLRKVEPHPSGWGLRYEFAPFTGRENAPAVPSSRYDDPRLKYVPASEDPAEHRLREVADRILSDLYDKAYEEWKDAAYVADLRQAVKDAPDRWKAYERELKALQAAYDYLRTPQAASEWPAAISRLVDAQERARAAAIAFDERARDIAAAHYKHLYADLGQVQALTKAGYPEAKDWHVGDGFDGYFSDSLKEAVNRLIEQQETHVTKVARLSGMGAG
ncbi:hypothetical protein ABZ499_31910 [Streptomyces sp. NPDC019990]|uniref:hypothetical protein n=1 Tax=Streptomyces sp. NPDC019990 TaxID=3154693 RepID=UPI0033E99780